MTQTSIKPFSTYPEDRERLLKLCDDVELSEDVLAHRLADFVRETLHDEEHLEEVTAERRLRDAAPDLLEAAEQALNFIENTESELGITLESGIMLRAAIKRALEG